MHNYLLTHPHVRLRTISRPEIELEEEEVFAAKRGATRRRRTEGLKYAVRILPILRNRHEGAAATRLTSLCALFR